jgi:hypothetical protein
MPGVAGDVAAATAPAALKVLVNVYVPARVPSTAGTVTYVDVARPNVS